MDSTRAAALHFLAHPEARREWMLDVAAGRMKGRELSEWSHALMLELTGWKWWEVNTLIVTSLTPGVLGRLVLAGVDPGRVTLGQWCAAVWAVLTEHADAKQAERLKTELSLPPEGYEDAWDDDEEYYAAMLAQAGKFQS